MNGSSLNLKAGIRRTPRNRPWRAIASLMLVAALLTTSGCFGRFPLTKSLYRMNTNISDNEFYQSLTFWGFTLTLIYPAFLIVDTVVLNTIQFWTGEELRLDEGPDQDFEIIPRRGAELDGAPGAVRDRVTLQTAGAFGLGLKLELERKSAREFYVLDRSDNRAGLLRMADDGALAVCAVDGTLIRRLPPGHAAARR